MSPLKVVFDTNVYIAASQNPSGLANYWLQEAGRQYQLYVSPDILDELEVKLGGKFGLSAADVRLFRSAIEALATVVHPARRIRAVPDDPDDDKIIECAVEAGADLIVSADRHLYKLKRYGSIQIVQTRMLKYLFPQASAA